MAGIESDSCFITTGVSPVVGSENSCFRLKMDYSILLKSLRNALKSCSKNTRYHQRLARKFVGLVNASPSANLLKFI